MHQVVDDVEINVILSQNDLLCETNKIFTIVMQDNADQCINLHLY